MATATAKGAGLPDIARVLMPEDMFVETVKDVRPSVEGAMGDIINALTKWKAPAKKVEQPPLIFKGKDYADALEQMNETFLERRMSDGFPLLPPTKERVEWILSGTNLPPDELVGCFEDLYRPVTVRTIAINAAMAGARPEYLPVIIAAFRSIGKSNFQHFLFGSTSASAPMTIINGPIAKQLNINSGIGLMGPGWKANARIGRSISLTLINGVGQVPGPEGPSIQSLPGRYSWCWAEREESIPGNRCMWKRGFPGMSVLPPYSAPPARSFL